MLSLWSLFGLFLMMVCCYSASSPKLGQSLTASKRPTQREYAALRDAVFNYEQSLSFGADIQLNQQELLVNHMIMSMKTTEYEDGMITPHRFKPSQHFFSVVEEIRKSPLFQIIKSMPKGGVLHAHDTALASTDVLLNMTYREHLWVCQGATPENLVVSMKFSLEQPSSNPDANCNWSLLSTVRDTVGSATVDQYLRSRFTMYPTEKFLDNNGAWDKFFGIFSLLDGLLFFAPVWADYYYSALQEFYADGVQYLEFRTTLPVLYDLEGNTYTEMDTVRIYKETLDKFMQANPGFIGSKMIYAPIRNADHAGMEHYIRVCIEAKNTYPDFVAGFDLVGQEEKGIPLKDYAPQLLTMPDDIDFFFHAGETNWFGSFVDENLIDAILLGTKRIGHGFAITKHPWVMQMVKERNIAVEINPISNQVLQLESDYRNHPCGQLFANNYPVVISSDDPSFWKATPLSHDFYVAFLGIASAHAGLRLLKKLVLNSINYSALSTQQKMMAIQKWQTQWDAFIGNLFNRGLFQLPAANTPSHHILCQDVQCKNTKVVQLIFNNRI